MRHISAYVWYALIVIYKWFDYKYRRYFLSLPPKNQEKKSIISVRFYFLISNYLSDWAHFCSVIPFTLWFHKVIAASQHYSCVYECFSISLKLKIFTTCFDRFLIWLFSFHFDDINLGVICMFVCSCIMFLSFYSRINSNLLKKEKKLLLDFPQSHYVTFNLYTNNNCAS